MFLRPDDDRPALVDADHGVTLTHRELAAAAGRFPAMHAGEDLLFLFADGSVDSVVAYVVALDRGVPVALLDAGLHPEQAAALVERYRPTLLVGAPAGAGGDDFAPVAPGVERRTTGAGPVVHPDLAVLLTTSGSTGSPKFVRLSRGNIAANTAAIVASLGLTADDRAITTLPTHYSFGMSVLNTHLAVGGSVVLTAHTILEPPFWDTVREHRPTSLSGVPYTFHILRRLGFAKMDVPSITTLTQAGGRLEASVAEQFAQLMADRGGRMFVMYGQTEAAPRMTCVEVAADPSRCASAGRPLDGGSIEIIDPDGRALPPGETGDVVYRGPNVMMGYAQDADDLALGDIHGDLLQTGDLGFLDDDGLLRITGRTKRIGKLFGTRVSLDEVEQMLQARGPVAVVAGKDLLVVHCEWPDSDGNDGYDDQRRKLSHDLRLPISAIRFRRTEPLPKTASGKIDYPVLERSGRST